MGHTCINIEIRCYATRISSLFYLKRSPLGVPPQFGRVCIRPRFVFFFLSQVTKRIQLTES